jgi:hypothetical protein
MARHRRTAFSSRVFPHRVPGTLAHEQAAMIAEMTLEVPALDHYGAIAING